MISLLVNAAYFGLHWNGILLYTIRNLLHQYHPEWEIEVVFTVY